MELFSLYNQAEFCGGYTISHLGRCTKDNKEQFTYRFNGLVDTRENKIVDGRNYSFHVFVHIVDTYQKEWGPWLESKGFKKILSSFNPNGPNRKKSMIHSYCRLSDERIQND